MATYEEVAEEWGIDTDPANVTSFQLPQFLDCVRWVLDRITGAWNNIFIVKHRRPIMRSAYDDLVNRNVFGETKSQATAAANQEKLKDAGLTGIQLSMKLEKFLDIWRNFWTNGGIRWLDRVLGWMNKILKSLAAAVPGGEAIAELKDACEEEIKDTDLG